MKINHHKLYASKRCAKTVSELVHFSEIYSAKAEKTFAGRYLVALTTTPAGHHSEVVINLSQSVSTA